MNTSTPLPVLRKVKHLKKEPVFLFADLISIGVILMIIIFKVSILQALDFVINLFI